MLIQTNTIIFYADDDPDDRSFFEDVAAGLGEDVKVFELGEEMLTQMRNPPPLPSVVFLDLNMPIKDGFQILEEIRSSVTFGKVPVIILSTTSSDETIKRCFKLGASLYVTKAVSLDDLKKVLKYVMLIDWENHKIEERTFVFRP